MAEYIVDTDHAGADFALVNGDVVAGVHTNVKRFSIPAGATVYLKTYTGAAYGTFEVQAAIDAIIAGVFDAIGSGYGAGGGGSPCAPGRGYAGGAAGYGYYGLQGNYSGPWGGIGGGPYGGNDGNGKGSPDANNYDGYPATNETPDDSLTALKGSAGGGGSGGGCAYNGVDAYYGRGGGAGYSGGGAIKIYAPIIYIPGQTLSNDKPHGNGQGGVVNRPDLSNAGHADVAGSSALGGGRGAGGGIILQFSNRLAQITARPRIYIPGVVNNQGGLGATNGGTIKVNAPTKSLSGTISTRTSGVRYINKMFATMAS